MPAGTLYMRNFGFMRARRTRRTTSDRAPPMNAAGAQLGEVAHHVVRNGAVDLVFHRRVDLQAEQPAFLHKPSSSRNHRARPRKSPGRAAGCECARPPRARPARATVARRAGGRDAVDDTQPLGHAEHAAAKGPMIGASSSTIARRAPAGALPPGSSDSRRANGRRRRPARGLSRSTDPRDAASPRWADSADPCRWHRCRKR